MHFIKVMVNAFNNTKASDGQTQKTNFGYYFAL